MKIVLNPAYSQLSSFVNNIPIFFDKKGELIYGGRNKLKVYQVDGYDVVVKSFRKPHLFNRIVYTFFRLSKARRSYEHAFELLKREVPTPAPIAYIEEKRGGLLNRSYYISVYAKDYEHVRPYMNATYLDDVLLTELAQFIALLHNKGVYFLDLSPGNVLWKKEDERFLFTLVDINRMKFKLTLSKKERYENFERLSYKNDVITFMACKYAKASYLDDNEAVTKIREACKRFFEEKYNRPIQ